MKTTLGSPEPAAPSIRHRWATHGSDALRYRAGVAVRALVAIVGGYYFSALCATVIALYLPTTPVEAAITATMAAFVVYPCVAIWVFAARTALLATLGVLVPAAVLGAILLVHYA